MRARNVSLVFVTDPPQSFGGSDHRKSACFSDRTMQKMDKIKQIQSSLAEPEVEGRVQLESARPVPAAVGQLADANRAVTTRLLQQTNGCFPFAREKLRGVLKKHGITVTTAVREADEELGDLVRKGRAYAVLAEDSDFFCMKGVRYIPFSKLVITESEANVVAISARVFTPELVAATLGLKTDQLVDLALVCGNDLTLQLDNEFAMATDLNFPIQRTQRSGSMTPRDAAMWIAHRPPVLASPVLNQIETKRPGFLAALHEIYRFYGYGASFVKKFHQVSVVRPAMSKKKLKTYRLLLDRYNFPLSAIDVLEASTCGLPNKFDPLQAAGRPRGKTLNLMLVPVRQLSYRALNVFKVDEFERGGTVQYTIRLKKNKALAALAGIPVTMRNGKQTDELLRSLVFSMLYSSPDEIAKAKKLNGLLGKSSKAALSTKTIVYSLLLLWMQDRAYLGDACLLGPRDMEVFLLSSLVIVWMEEAKKKNFASLSAPLSEFDEHRIDWELFASVSAYVEMLRLVYQLRMVVGDKLPDNTGCPSLFSAEVFLHVCVALSRDAEDLPKSKVGNSSDQHQNLSKADVTRVAERLLGQKNINGNKIWCEYCRVRSAMFHMKSCSGTLTKLDESVHRRRTSTERGLEKVLINSPPPPALKIVHTEYAQVEEIEEIEYVEVVNDWVSLDTKAPPFVIPAALPPLPPPLPSDLLPNLLQSTKQPLDSGLRAVSTPTNSQKSASIKQNSQVARGLTPSSVAKRMGSTVAGKNSKKRIEPMVVEPSFDAEPKEPPNLSGLMQTLPVFAHRTEILQNVAVNQLTIIQGETGCGKSTSVPQFLHDEWAHNGRSKDRPVNIYVTQPRRIAAIELANTVARMRKGNEFDEDGSVGKVVGYRIGQKQCISSSTKITYVTTGYMVERLIHDPNALASITHLVLDEVHERSMDVDILLLLLRLQLSQHSHLRLVIMSATMDAKVLIKYLGEALSSRLIRRKPLFVGSKLFSVENVLLDDLNAVFPGMSQRCRQDVAAMNAQFDKLSQQGVSAKSELAIKAIAKIHEKQLVVLVEMVRQLIKKHQDENSSQCILIFVPGINSINTLFDELTTLVNVMRLGEAVKVLVLHSNIELENQQKAFETLGRRTTKIVLSTNIAESSVTIPDVTHVINCAIEKQIEMPNAGSTHAEVLIDTWCSRASVVQRSGRAGRLRPGTAFHLITHDFRARCMAEYSTPEILRKPLDRIILLLKGRLEQFGLPSALLDKALDAPDLASIDGAYKLLAEFDAVNSSYEEDAQLTKFGQFVCRLPLNLQLCRLMMTGCCLSEESSATRSPSFLLNVVILVATLAAPDLFVIPSFYHSHSAMAYIKEMKANLKAKIAVDGGMWSEPLAQWRFYIKTMSEQPLHHKRNLGSTLQKVSMSFRRFQTLNFLISDLCSRLISVATDRSGEFDGLLNDRAVAMLRRLDTYASGQQIDKELLAFSKQTLSDERNEERVLRFLLIQNYGDQLIGGKLKKPTEFTDDDMDGTDRVDMRIDKEQVRAFSKLSNADKATLFDQLASSNNVLDEFAAFAYENRSVSLYPYQSPRNQPAATTTTHSRDISADSLSRMSFPISLIYYVRGEKFPVNLGMRANDDDDQGEIAFKLFVANSSGSDAMWTQEKDNAKVQFGNRSLFTLPVRPEDGRSKLLAVYADRLFTGNETRMFCSKCTLLPPDNVSYYPIVLLVSAPRRANIWLYVNVKAGEILTVNVDGQIVEFPHKTPLRLDTLGRINALRKALSGASNGDPTASVGVADVLALVDQAVTVTKNSKTKQGQYEWRQLKTEDPEDVRGKSPPRLPELVLV